MAGYSRQFRIEGLDEILEKLVGYQLETVKSVEKSLYTWGEQTLTRAKEEFVPVRFGFLRASGETELQVDGDALLVEISFGKAGPATEYAVFVHEIPANHAVGQDKYLEIPAMEESAHLGDDVKDGLKEDGLL